jgi:hypothetical protein
MTAMDNRFQIKPTAEEEWVAKRALQEFDFFVDTLKNNGIEVTVLQDTKEPFTPDSIFPNNWISFHEGSCAYIYPMYAPNRRLEKKPAFLKEIKQVFSIEIMRDWSRYEEDGIFLEGTGSMIFDRKHRIAYACLSERTNETLFRKWCETEGYSPCSFQAFDQKGAVIYHTNVMMSIADQYAVVCMESIMNISQRTMLLNHLEFTHKQLIETSFGQMNEFACNVLQLQNKEGEPILVMSSRAFNNFNKEQISQLEKFNKIIHAPLETIETAGGGGARCMMAEVFE